MRIFIDVVTLLPTGTIWDRAEIIPNASAKRGDGTPLEIQFHRSGVPERLPIGTVITFIGKTAGKYDQETAPVELELTDANRPADDAGYYTGEPDLNTQPLDEALASGDDDDENDLPFVLLDGEVSWLLPGVDQKPKSSKTFPLRIDNDVKKGNEGAASAGGPTYLTAAQIAGTYLAGRLAAAELTIGQDYVDFDISAQELEDPPEVVSGLGVQKPNAGAANIFIVGVHATDEETVRAWLSAEPTETGYTAHLFFKP